MSKCFLQELQVVSPLIFLFKLFPIGSLPFPIAYVLSSNAFADGYNDASKDIVMYEVNISCSIIDIDSHQRVTLMSCSGQELQSKIPYDQLRPYKSSIHLYVFLVFMFRYTHCIDPHYLVCTNSSPCELLCQGQSVTSLFIESMYMFCSTGHTALACFI